MQHTREAARPVQPVAAPPPALTPISPDASPIGDWHRLVAGEIPEKNRLVNLLRPPYPDGTPRLPVVATLRFAKDDSREPHWVMFGGRVTVAVEEADVWSYLPPPPEEWGGELW